MDEVLNKLIASEFLTEETKSELAVLVESYKKQLREDIEIEVRSDLVKQWADATEELSTKLNRNISSILAEEVQELREDIQEQKNSKKMLVEAADRMINQILEEEVSELRADIEATKSHQKTLVEATEKLITQSLSEEIAELKDDIENFRDLETEYAGKLVEERRAMAEQLSEELDRLVDHIDEFLELRLKEELDELREDINETRKDDFGRKIFESFKDDFAKYFREPGSVESKLAETEDRLKDVTTQLAEMKKVTALKNREAVMEQVLSPLSGSKRDQMEIILANVATNKLEETYKKFISNVLNESKDKSSDKQRLDESTSKLVTGNKQTLVETNNTEAELLAKARRLAGIL